MQVNDIFCKSIADRIRGVPGDGTGQNLNSAAHCANLAWNIVCTCNVHNAFLLPCFEWVGEMKLDIDIGHDVQNKAENQDIEVEFLSWVLPLAYMFLFENTIEQLKVICC